MFERLVEDGHTLAARVERQLREGADKLPPKERVFVDELKAWYTAALETIIHTFGEDSPEVIRWGELHQRLQNTDDEEAGKGYFDVSRSNIRRLSETMGLLKEMQYRALIKGASPQPSGLFVFVSYSHVDATLAREIASDLDSLGVAHFSDEKAITWGQSITQAVRQNLSKASHQIILLSPASLKSQWVHFEVGYAIASGKTVLPFLTHPSLDVPGYLGDLLWKKSRDELRDYFKALQLSASKMSGKG